MPLFGRPPNWVSHGRNVHWKFHSNAKHCFLPVLISVRQQDFAFCGKRLRAPPQDPAAFEKAGETFTFRLPIPHL